MADVAKHVEAVTGMSVGPANRKTQEFYQRRLQRHLRDIFADDMKKRKLAAKAATAAAKAGQAPTPKTASAGGEAVRVKAKAKPTATKRKPTKHATVGLVMPSERRRALAKNCVQPPFTIVRSTVQWREMNHMLAADQQSGLFRAYWHI